LRPKLNGRKKAIRKWSENNGHGKLMVEVKWLNLKHTRKEEGGEFWAKGAQDRWQLLCFLLSPEGQCVLRKRFLHCMM
jgi:hypothetical protein